MGPHDETMSDALENLRIQRERFRRAYEETLQFKAWAAIDRAVKAIEEGLADVDGRTLAGNPLPLPPKSLMRVIEARAIGYMKSECRHLKTTEILERLRRDGVEFTGSIPIKNLRSILSRSDGLSYDRLRKVWRPSCEQDALGEARASSESHGGNHEVAATHT